MKKILYIALASLSLFSCTKEIQIDLNSSDPKLVIEATLNDQSDLASVKLFRSVNFSDPNVFPAVSDATVQISDSDGNTWQCIETTPGIYLNNQLRGVVGRTYFLDITLTDGQKFTAKSTLPKPVPLDSVSIIENTFGPGAGGDSTTYYVIPRYLDPAGEQNNYRFIQILNGNIDPTIIPRNDNVFNGKVNEQPLFSPDLEIHSGDVLEIEMMGIDRSVYDYFFSLSQSVGGDPNAASVPGNPISNLSGGALGYFSAFSLQKITVLVP
jgi:hypothetical protein